ncbi:MAG TPA: hypothetical protein VGI95_10825 [Caulobacteraceae bacterium]|jgi:uncharacterized repeat protein (TIGR01451 family)
MKKLLGAIVAMGLLVCASSSLAQHSFVLTKHFVPSSVLSTYKPPPGTAKPAPAPANVVVAVSADLSQPFHPGDTLTYTITATNQGGSPQSFLWLQQTLSDLAFVQGVPTCAQQPCGVAVDPNTGLVRIIGLAAGGTAAISVQTRAIAAGPFSVKLSAINGRAYDAEAASDVASLFGEIIAPPALPPPDNEIQPPPPVLKPDVTVVAELAPLPPYRAGQRVSMTILVGNDGTGAARDITVSDAPDNFQDVSVSGACAALPCTIASLEPGSSREIDVDAVIGSDAGTFDDRIDVATPGLPTRSAGVRGRVPAPPDRSPLHRIVTLIQRNPLPAGVVAIVLLGAGALLLRAIGEAAKSAQLKRWRKLVTATSALDRAGKTLSGPIPEMAPPVSLSVRIEPGLAAPRGPIPVERIS